MYEGVAHPFPLLGDFDGMREDGIIPEKCISDPSFFFEHWRYTMQMKTIGKKSSTALADMERDVSVLRRILCKCTVCMHACVHVSQC